MYHKNCVSSSKRKQDLDFVCPDCTKLKANAKFIDLKRFDNDENGVLQPIQVIFKVNKHLIQHN